MIRLYLTEFWCLLFAQVGCQRAPGMEPAAGRRIGRAGRVTFQDDAVPGTGRSRVRDRDDSCVRVDGRERVVGSEHTGIRQRVEKRRLAHVG